MAKSIDLGSIDIERVIVHDVPKHIKQDYTIPPKYSERESTLSDGLRSFFKDKVIQALGSDKAFKICYDSESESPISVIARDLISADGSTIVLHSKEIAKHLFDIQTGSNTAGIVVIIYGKVNSECACIILKLERDKGAQLTLDPITQSYNIEEVQNLMLTQKTKIFKVALFIDRDCFKCKYDGVIMDYQIDVKAKRDAITWFITRFLGCRAFEDPKITTQRFYNLTRSYIGTLPELLDRAKYLQDLNSYVQKTSSMMSAQEFADDYLRTSEERVRYRNYLKEKKFKLSGFHKDLRQIERQVKKITVQFDNDISVIGNKGTFKDNVKMKKLTDGKTRAEITARIKYVG